jgi:hypothetical protein
MNFKSIKNNIQNIHSIINKKLIYYNNILTKRQRNLTYNDVLFLLCSKNFSGDSYNSINCSMGIENKNTATKTAFIKKRNLFNYTYINNINNDLLSFIYKKNNCRFLAVDGTHINMDKSMVKHGFSLSKNKCYTTGLISCIFDIKNKITINYHLVNHNDERKAFLEQLLYLKEGDTLIFDRGYYSEELVKILSDKKINFIFRMKKDSKMVKQLNKEKLSIKNMVIRIKKNNIPAKILKYEVNLKNINNNFEHQKMDQIIYVLI